MLHNRLSVPYMVLARKLRPRNFKDLVGQEVAITILKNIIVRKTIHHAYLLTGTRGVGKTTIARIIAKALNCKSLHDGAEPCCICEICIAIDNGRFIDSIEIDAASNTGVDNIREVIENAQFVPIDGAYKVYIIDEVHMLSKSAFNAMLKILEEPPSHVIFILATTDIQKLPITILSRCLQLQLRNLTSTEIAQYISGVLKDEQIEFDDYSSLELIAQHANGSMRDGLSILDQIIAFTNGNITYAMTSKILGSTDNSVVYEILDAIVSFNGTSLVNIAKRVYLQGTDLENCLNALAKILCEINIAQLTRIDNQSFVSDKYVSTMHVNDVQLYFEICNLGIEQIKNVTDKYSTFIMTLLRMLAFKLGTRDNKNMLLHNVNHDVNNNLDSKVENSNTMGSSLIEQSNKATTLSKFSGNWVELVGSLSPLLKHSAPFLESSELISFIDNMVSIKIDSRYKGSFSNHAVAEITTVLSKYFNVEIFLSYTFASGLYDTVKGKKIEKIEEDSNKAKQAIDSDEKLIMILDKFSAKILDGSIVSVVKN